MENRNLKNMKNLSLYPNGFIGPDLTVNNFPNIQQKDQDSDSELLGNPDIDSLYASYISDPFIIDNFEFKEALLSLAKKMLFPFEIFLKNQFFSPNLTINHVRFLEQMLKYISSNYKGISLNTWRNIINGNNVKQSDSDKIRLKKVIEQANEIFKEFDILNMPNKIVDTIILSKWISQPDGVCNLLQTMYIIFGSSNEVRKAVI